MIDKNKIYVFTKSGSIVKPVKKQTGKYPMWTVERVDNGKRMMVTEKSL
jgi:hypothetical protein